MRLKSRMYCIDCIKSIDVNIYICARRIILKFVKDRKELIKVVKREEDQVLESSRFSFE
jgi:hypothetical protein